MIFRLRCRTSRYRYEMLIVTGRTSGRRCRYRYRYCTDWNPTVSSLYTWYEHSPSRLLRHHHTRDTIKFRVLFSMEYRQYHHRSSFICFDVSSLSSSYYSDSIIIASVVLAFARADCFVNIVHEEWYCNEPDIRHPEQEELLLFPEEFSIRLHLNSMEVIAIVCQARRSKTLRCLLNRVSVARLFCVELDCPTASHHHNWNKKLLCRAILEGLASRRCHSNQDSWASYPSCL